jgi:tetratricopeptide (TPR) repeat protein
MYAHAILTMLAVTSVPVAMGSPSSIDDLHAGVAAASEQDWQTAHDKFRQAAQQSANPPLAATARLAAAEALFQQGRYDEAGKLYGVLYETMHEGTRPANTLVTLRWAHCLAHQKQWNAAAKVAQTGIDREPHSAQRGQLEYILGCSHSASGAYEVAKEQFFQIIRSPQVAEALRHRALWMLAYTYAAEGEMVTARETYLRLEELAQKTPALAARALVEAGRCSERRGRWKVASDTYQQAVDKYAASENSHEARRRLAVVQIRQDQAKRR